MIPTNLATALSSFGLALLLCIGCNQTTSDSGSKTSQEPATSAKSPSHSQSSEQSLDSVAVNATDLQKETGEALHAARKYTVRKMDEYRTDMEQRLNTVQKHIDELKKSAGEATRHWKPEIHDMLDTMEKKLAATRKTLREKREETAESWDKMREGIESSVTELEKTAGEVRNQFGNNESDSAGPEGKASTVNESSDSSSP